MFFVAVFGYVTAVVNETVQKHLGTAAICINRHWTNSVGQVSVCGSLDKDKSVLGIYKHLTEIRCVLESPATVLSLVQCCGW